MDSARKNLQLLWWLRTIAIIGQASAVFVVVRVFSIPLPALECWLILTASALVNIASLPYLKHGKVLTHRFFFTQLMLDILALAGLLYFTGGASNPFSSLFILQVMIAAILLPPRHAWSIAGITVLFYTLLVFFNRPVDYLHHHHLGDFFSMHLHGMWISFVVLAFAVAAFLVRMQQTLKERDMQLAVAEQAASLGTLAASAAHALGTPLSTIMVIAGESGNPLLLKEVERCKEIVRRIADSAGLMKAEAGRKIALDAFLNALIARWQQENPAVQLSYRTPGATPAPSIVVDYTLEQAITNVLDNAGDAGTIVDVTATWEKQMLELTVQDNGPGFTKTLLQKQSELGHTTKPDGLGLGLALTSMVFTRLGGTVALTNQKGGRALLVLPLKGIIA